MDQQFLLISDQGQGVRVASKIYSQFEVLLRKRASIFDFKFDWETLRSFGFSAAEAKAAGCDLANAASADYDSRSLVAAFDLNDIFRYGIIVGSFVIVSHLQPPTGVLILTHLSYMPFIYDNSPLFSTSPHPARQWLLLHDRSRA
jgi:hypothetical protein